MDIGLFGHFAMNGLSLIASLFVVAVGIFALMIAVMFVADVSQTKDAIRCNYPVIGRFRTLFTTLGECFRQYFSRLIVRWLRSFGRFFRFDKWNVCQG